MKAIEINGTGYQLEFSVNAICALEEYTHKGFSECLTGEFSALRNLLWCGLLKHHPKLTRAQAGDLLEQWIGTGASPADISEILSEAVSASGFLQPPQAVKKTPPMA